MSEEQSASRAGSADAQASPRLPGPPGPAGPPGPSRTNWLGLVAIGVAVFMTTVDLLIVQAALPAMNREFGMSPQLGQWLILAYALVTIALQMPAGRWIDSVSARRAFMMAIAGFTLASVLAAVAPDVPVLLAARVLQGAFGAVLGAVVPGLVMGAAAAQDRGKAMGIVGTLGPLGAVSGPALGGLLLSVWDWRGIFLVNVPVGALALYLGMRSIPAGGRLTLPGAGYLRETLAAVLAGGALFAALTLASERDPNYALVVLALVVVVLAGVWWYREPGGHQVFGLLRVGRLGFVLLALFGINIVGGVLNYLPPFTLERLLSLPVAQWGLVLSAMPLGLAVSNFGAGFVTDRWGPGRTSIAGTLIIAAGTASLAATPTWGGSVSLGLRLFLIGLGMGCYHVPTQTLFMTQAPPQLMGTAGAAINLLRQLGFSVGPALGTLVWFSAGSGSSAGLRAAYWIPIIAALVTVVLTVTIVTRAAPAREAASQPVG